MKKQDRSKVPSSITTLSWELHTYIYIYDSHHHAHVVQRLVDGQWGKKRLNKYSFKRKELHLKGKEYYE